MISTRVQEAINAQINAEFWSAYLYLSMSADFAVKGKPGFANWMKIQFKEEQDHANIFMDYLIKRGGVVELKPIEEVKLQWNTPLDAFKDTLEHEKIVTSLINKLYKIADEEGDIATVSMLKWFIDEQVEEEETAQALIDALTMIGDNGYGIYSLDKELGARTYTPVQITSAN